MLFDSHAHINNTDMTPERVEELVSQVENSTLEYVTDIGFDLPSSRKAVENAARYPWCYAAVGVHPHDTDDMDDMTLYMIKSLAAKPKVQAIGEIGLDFHYDNSDRDAQRTWFRRQIRLANELKMPIVIHSREADQETMDILKEEGAFTDERKSWFPQRPDSEGFVGGTPGNVPDARVLIHCFSGSAELASQYVKLGATISIAGPVTYKNNRKTVAAAAAVPIDFLLVETDSPYLTPEPLRGRRNSPVNVEYTARKIAEIKGMDYEEVAARTNSNACRFYGIVRR
ncbi:MAG: TatD family hydrolase [Firmicutes bacterium]|nr:TatD family hydrolase [Bacillota bacterium]MDY4959229.1 TatD family hydrolase [Lentihominibacter sp.]